MHGDGLALWEFKASQGNIGRNCQKKERKEGRVKRRAHVNLTTLKSGKNSGVHQPRMDGYTVTDLYTEIAL